MLEETKGWSFIIDSCPQGGDSNKRVQIHLPPSSTGRGSNSLKPGLPAEYSEAHKKARSDREGESMDVSCVERMIQDDMKTGW